MQDKWGLLKVSSHKDLRLSGSQEMNEQLLLADITQRSEDVRAPNHPHQGRTSTSSDVHAPCQEIIYELLQTIIT